MQLYSSRGSSRSLDENPNVRVNVRRIVWITTGTHNVVPDRCPIWIDTSSLLDILCRYIEELSPSPITGCVCGQLRTYDFRKRRPPSPRPSPVSSNWEVHCFVRSL